MATKQFMLFFAVTFLMFALLAGMNYQRASRLFKNQIVDDAQTLMVRTNQFLDTYLDNGQNILLLLSSQTGLLESPEAGQVEGFLRSAAENNSTIVKTLYIVTGEGRVYSNAQVYYEVLGNPMLPALYEQAKGSYSSVVSQPYSSPQSGYTVAIARQMLDQMNRSAGVAGVAVVELDLEKLMRKVSEVKPENQTFVLMSSQGQVVAYDNQTDLLPSKPEEFATVLPEFFLGDIYDLPTGTSHYDGPAGRLVTLKSGQNRMGWSLIFFIKESYFYQNVSVLLDDFKAVALVTLVVLFVTAFIMSRFFTRPIRLLASRMDRVQDMEVIPNINMRRNDEIGRLAASFNAMMERIRGLLEETREMDRRKQELELKVLQSQIAPHFLYNTLACIGSLARQQRTGDVKETIRSLVGLLKLTFDRTTEFVRVEEELDGLLRYLQIQRMRYGDKFIFINQVEKDTMDLAILKLTLQPLVENAIFHGIVPSGRTGEIHIRSRIKGGKLVFYIRDNGVGMEREQLRLIREARNGKPMADRFTGIGVNNVHDRLRLHFGEPWGLRIRTIPGMGTVVAVRLPVRPAEGMVLESAPRLHEMEEQEG
ncbi:MAG: histidine kinase [Paenibacillaceae bacterium]|jgi:sensor histidine kinase YesM|nr:histidine kinase [Paenibacillaceae bacterium]